MTSSADYYVKPLPFENDLKGISARTIEIHHDKLYEGYVAKMKEVGAGLSEFATGKKELAGNQTYSELRALRLGETFARNGVYLHEYYFDVLGGDGKVPDNALTSALIEKFGSIQSFIDYFSASAMSIRGWILLALDLQDDQLHVYGCDSHNHGGVWGCMPIIVLDVYEHAYYLDHGSDRKSYIVDYWKNFNWDVANKLYEKWSSMDA
ncbi:MAG: superoxide dismutase [bacterium]